MKSDENMTTTRHPQLLDPSDTLLLVIDVQERFRPVMKGFDSMVAGCARLVRTFRALGLPIIVTEQYPKGLGATVPELKEVLGDVQPLEKTIFSSYGCAGVPELISDSRARKVLVCGIETHVCVSQTVHDLLAAGYQVHVAVDAVESRHDRNRELALGRMEHSGAVLTSSETAAFELMADAKHEKFKEIQALFK
jgi:nicotinamidase-related amidase